MAAATSVDIKTGGVVSMVRLRACELMDLFPAELLVVAVMAMVPSDSAAPSGTVMLHLPSESLVVIPRKLPSAKSSTVPPTSAVPVKVGVVSLVRLSDSELPVSEAELSSGLEGASGAVTSRLLMENTTDLTDELPAASVATTVNE